MSHPDSFPGEVGQNILRTLPYDKAPGPNIDQLKSRVVELETTLKAVESVLQHCDDADNSVEIIKAILEAARSKA
jgi:hypothetical protein